MSKEYVEKDGPEAVDAYEKCKYFIAYE